MRRLRVLIVRNAFHKDTGGAEQYAYNLALALRNAGHIPVIVTNQEAIHKRCSKAHLISVQGKWHTTQEWGRHYYLRYILMTLWYMWLILRYRIHVVHPQGRDDFVFATNAGQLLHRRIIWTDHADLKYVLDRVNHRHPRMQTWLIKAAARSSAIICVSKSERTAIAVVAPEIKNKLVVVHNGVFKPYDIEPVAKKGFIIGTNARLVESKGIGELITAFSGVQKSIPGSKLWLVGGASGNKHHYEKLAKNAGILDQVKFFDYVQNPNDYVASMDIFIHASYHEAFSLAIIEAAMLGRPIIATCVGGTPEIITSQTGILIEPRDSAALTQAILRYYRDPALMRKYGDAVQTQAVKNFDFQTIVENRIIKLYEEGLPT